MPSTAYGVALRSQRMTREPVSVYVEPITLASATAVRRPATTAANGRWSPPVLIAAKNAYAPISDVSRNATNTPTWRRRRG